MVFPWYKISDEGSYAVPHFLKLEPLTNDRESLTSLESIPIKPYGLFGWNTVSENDKEVRLFTSLTCIWCSAICL